MDPTQNVPLSDLQLLVLIPLVIFTCIEARKNWRKIWDNDLSLQDRQILGRINFAILLPLVVLLHESGHAVATIWAGGKVLEFHFGGWWGYVVPSGNFSAQQDLIISLAGSVVQIVAGLIALLTVFFVESPPLVALLVYFGLFSIGGTVVIYALLSLGGMYGDWLSIYSSPLKNWVGTIAMIHAGLIIGLLYLMLGTSPRLFFLKKTRPKWFKDFKRAQELVAKNPSAVNYLNLAWCYYFVDMEKQCMKALAQCGQVDPGLADRFMLEGWLKQGKGDFDGAVQSFQTIAENPGTEPMLKCRALMAIGHCLMQKMELARLKLDREAVSHVIAAYSQAEAAEPEVADPRFYKATVLNKIGMHQEAENELNKLRGLRWLDPALQELLTEEFLVARRSDKSKQ